MSSERNPSAFDRLLCTRLGKKQSSCWQGVYNVMIGYNSGLCKPIPLEQVAESEKSFRRITP